MCLSCCSAVGCWQRRCLKCRPVRCASELEYLSGSAHAPLAYVRTRSYFTGSPTCCSAHQPTRLDWLEGWLSPADEARCAQSKDVLSSLRARYAVPQLAAAAAAVAAPSAWLSWIACGAVVTASPIPLQVPPC